MKKILIQIDSNKVPSSFDAITALDSGVDQILSYGGVMPGEVRDIVYGAMFTRGESDLKKQRHLYWRIKCICWEKYCLRRQWIVFSGPQGSL